MPTIIKPASEMTKKLLVVEDDGEIALIFDMILNDKEFDMDYVNNILDADEYLQKNKPDLIILDNQLPDGFGVDFITYIRKKYPDMKIIMVSGYGSARDVALANGANRFFEKPFSLDEFYSAVDELVK